MSIEERFARLGLAVPEILLPQNVDLKKWAVIACDQFTQDRNYWERVKNAVGDSPSALNLIFPEVFLPDGDSAARIAAIHQTMRRYLDEGVFSARHGCVYLERDTPFQRKRRGLVIAVDLEQYDWSPDAKTLIRATEGTVPERLPPRMDIRRGAPLESPHILILIDDDDESLLPALGERVKNTVPAYQTPLMMDSGNASGWFIYSDDDLSFIAERFEKLAQRALVRYQNEKVAHNGLSQPPFLFAVGDGNHSLATAKEIWNEYKKAHNVSGDVLPDHPCRYVLIEIENLYDPAITFEPIHRLVFGIDFDETLTLLSELPGFSSRVIADREELVHLVTEPCEKNRMGIVNKNHYALIETSAPGLATVSLQPLLDRCLAAKKFVIDYIHGKDELFRLACAVDSQTTGILLPPIKKAGLFETVARHGVLPRKSFSMGEAEEKRFYLECRKIC